MNIVCSSCSAPEADDFKVVPSKVMPKARWVACPDCLENNYEPRPLIILGTFYGDKSASTRHIKDSLYAGEEIRASEINLDE